MARKRTGEGHLAAALDAIGRLDLEGLRQRWRALTGTTAPPSFRCALLQAAIAYKLQEQVYGGLKPGTLRLLIRVAAQADHAKQQGQPQGDAGVWGQQLGHRLPTPGQADPDAQPTTERGGGNAAAGRSTVTGPSHGARHPTVVRVKPGTRLLRTWQGKTHEVLVTDTGVLWRGRPYRSLSEVARTITGQRWSGPLFFGLKRRA